MTKVIMSFFDIFKVDWKGPSFLDMNDRKNGSPLLLTKYI